jgi:hypothetical protein
LPPDPRRAISETVPIMRGAMLCLTAAATLLTGCASENWLRLKKESFPTASAKNPVVRVLAVWQVGEGQGPDGLTTRGFAGQIFFLDAKDQIPAKVDGEVRVYVFDDQGSAEDRDKPLHQFDYPRESWKVRMTPTKMGPAYVVFVPYTRKGSHKAVCSLRLRYTPADGGAPLFSDMAQVSLPGRDGSDEERFALEKSRERTAEHLSDDPSADLPQRDVARRPSASRNVDESAHARESSRTTRQSPETIASHSRAEPRRAAPLTAREKERLVAEALARADIGFSERATSTIPEPLKMSTTRTSARSDLRDAADIRFVGLRWTTPSSHRTKTGSSPRMTVRLEADVMHPQRMPSLGAAGIRSCGIDRSPISTTPTLPTNRGLPRTVAPRSTGCRALNAPATRNRVQTVRLRNGSWTPWNKRRLKNWRKCPVRIATPPAAGCAHGRSTCRDKRPNTFGPPDGHPKQKRLPVDPEGVFIFGKRRRGGGSDFFFHFAVMVRGVPFGHAREHARQPHQLALAGAVIVTVLVVPQGKSSRVPGGKHQHLVFRTRTGTRRTSGVDPHREVVLKLEELPTFAQLAVKNIQIGVQLRIDIKLFGHSKFSR